MIWHRGTISFSWGYIQSVHELDDAINGVIGEINPQ